MFQTLSGFPQHVDDVPNGFRISHIFSGCSPTCSGASQHLHDFPNSFRMSLAFSGVPPALS